MNGCVRTNKHIYIHAIITNMQTYIPYIHQNTYIQYIHTYVHNTSTYIHAKITLHTVYAIHKYIHSYVRTYIHLIHIRRCRGSGGRRGSRMMCRLDTPIPREPLPLLLPVHTCMHTYIHAYIHTYMHTCIHTYIHTRCCMYARVQITLNRCVIIICNVVISFRLIYVSFRKRYAYDANVL